MQARPLDGIRVLDLTHVLAGPYCTYQLALLGADVIKVEPPRGDMVRPWGGTSEQIALGLGSGFIAQNAAKRSLAIDLETSEGAAIVGELAAGVDIVVENYRPGTMAGFGLSYDNLRLRNPAVVYVSISAFGSNGPHGGRPGFDDVVQATSGYMAMNVRGDGPLRTGGPVLDYATGMHATSAVLAAVLLRQQSGAGQHIDIAMQDVTMLLVNRHTSITATEGAAPPPAANRDGFLLGRYETKDGYVMLAGYLARHQRSICAALGLAELAALDGRQRRQRAAEVEAAVEARLAERTTAEWDAALASAGVVAGGVKDLAEVIATGQPGARSLLTEVETAAGRSSVTNAGYLINGEPFTPEAGVPRLGQHSREILGECGYATADIDRLIASSVIIEPDG